MRIFRLGFPLVCLWLLSWSSLNGANFLFVFHSAASTCSIYDADSLSLLGTPSVGTGAVKAFGVPDFNNPGQFSKFLVVTSNSIVSLNPTPPFSVRGTPLTLSGSLSSASNSAVLSPDGTWLLVAAGGQVQIVNTATDLSFAASLPTFAVPSSIAVLPTGRRAYVLSSGSPIIQIIELNTLTPFLLSTAVNLPSGSFPTAMGMAPNGSRLYVASPTPASIFEIDRFNNTVVATIPNFFFGQATSITFDPDPPVASAVLNGGSGAPVVALATRTVGNPFSASGLAIGKVVLPGANSAFFLAGSPGRLYRGFVSAGGALSEVINPQSGLSFGPNAVDMDASPDGSRLFVAFSDFRVIRIDPSGFATPQQVAPSLNPTSLSLVYPPASAAGVLEIYGGNNQSGVANTFFTIPLAVRARSSGPAFRQTVTFTSSTSGVSFSDTSPVTNLLGVAETFVQLPTASAVQVQATITSGGIAAPVTFNLNGGGGANPGGLSKVSGDKQVVLQSTSFPAPLVVQGVAGETLTVGVASGLAICTSPVVADASGLATISCSANAVAANTSIDISVTDATTSATLSDPFHVTILQSASDLPTMLSISTQPSPLVGPVGQTLPNALLIAASKANGSLVSDVGVEFAKPMDVTISPPTLVTSSSPVSASVTLGCSKGLGAITARLLAPNVPTQTVNFTTTPGPVTQLVKKQGDNQRGNAGQRLDGPGQALKVQATDTCGNPIASQAVTWSVNPSDAATLENVVRATDFEGNASVLVRLGSRAGSFTVTATAGSVSATFTLTVNVAPTQLLLISGNGQTVVLGQSLAQPLVVEVQDDGGNSVPGVDVLFNITSGTATLGASRATTDSRGRAQTTVQAGSTLGTITIVATAINRTVTFTITTVGRVPNVTTLGFVNSASFRVGWVPGSGGTIFGVGLMELSGVVAASTAPFPTTMRGVRVTVEGIDAPLISLVNINGQEQVNLQVPVGIPTGTVTVVISNNGSTATIPGVRVVAIQPAIFEFDFGGSRLAAALHLDFSPVTTNNPARPGEIILLFLTGLGATTPAIQTNVAGPVPAAVTVAQPVVGINDGGADVLGSFYAPGLYTAYQINFVIPLSAPSGLIKISVVAGGNASQDSRIPIGPPR